MMTAETTRKAFLFLPPPQILFNNPPIQPTKNVLQKTVKKLPGGVRTPDGFESSFE